MPIVGLSRGSCPSGSGSSHVDMSTLGRPTGKRSYDHSWSRSGHPVRMGFFPVLLLQPVHKPLVVAESTAEPQLNSGTWSSGASAMARA